jgi:hypothetical protein
MTAHHEAQAILKLCKGDSKAALEIVERHLNTLYARAQILLSLSGIVVTVTGFSGRLIAGSSSLAQYFLVAGLLVSLGSAAWICFNVMPIRWVTGYLAGTPVVAIEAILQRRNQKTKAYRIGSIILCIGLTLYCMSIALMLLNPVAIQGPVR